MRKFIQYILKWWKNTKAEPVSAGISPRKFIGMDPGCREGDKTVSYEMDISDSKISSNITEDLLEKSSEYAKERNKKLQFLHKCMMQYENKTGENLKKLRQNVLYRNNINSRSELTDEQLDQEIKYFTSI